MGISPGMGGTGEQSSGASGCGTGDSLVRWGSRFCQWAAGDDGWNWSTISFINDSQAR